MIEISSTKFKLMVAGGVKYLDLYRQQIDELNVFPVPDGDTGTNMSLTINSALREINEVETDSLSELAAAFSKGALKGARGNSGVILSQILKGFDVVCSDKETISSKDFAECLKKGTEIAYSAVTKPKEGTILTVIRVMAETAVSVTKHKQLEIEEFFTEILASGEAILEKTPEMLPILAKAGVVDAGGKGLLSIMYGFYNALAGIEIPDKVEPLAVVKKPTLSSADKEIFDNDYENITYAYCTEYFITNLNTKTTEADIDKHRDALLKIGDCVLVIGDLDLVKVHVHTNNPDLALKSALKLGEIDSIKIENMLQQNRKLKSNKPEVKKEKKTFGMVSICSGKGIADIFRDLQVDFVVEGGQTMNPSVYDILNAINKVDAKNVFVLPNNSNIILAAEQAKELADVNVFVIPTKYVPEGVAAALAFNESASAEENAETMTKAAKAVKCGEITHAVRNTKMNGFSVKVGDIIGITEKQIVSAGDVVEEVLIGTIGGMMDAEKEMLALYYGGEIDEVGVKRAVDLVKEKFPDLEVAVYSGGQPHYYFLLSLE
ncbi:MAG TPA: DAK2 domain-containing protein [Clostridia bacterium]|nr:DAK2 domain-containing protein [Clostridia bacterium]